MLRARRFLRDRKQRYLGADPRSWKGPSWLGRARFELAECDES